MHLHRLSLKTCVLDILSLGMLKIVIASNSPPQICILWWLYFSPFSFFFNKYWRLLHCSTDTRLTAKDVSLWWLTFRVPKFYKTKRINKARMNPLGAELVFFTLDFHLGRNSVLNLKFIPTVGKACCAVRLTKDRWTQLSMMCHLYLPLKNEDTDELQKQARVALVLRSHHSSTTANVLYFSSWGIFLNLFLYLTH